MSDRWTEEQINAYKGTWGGDELTVMDELKAERKRAEAAEAKVEELEALRTEAIKLWYEEQGRRQAAESRLAELEASALTGYEDGWHALRNERDDLKSKLESVKGLADKWRQSANTTVELFADPDTHAAIFNCADELQAVLDKAND
jgi:hypothetical protein